MYKEKIRVSDRNRIHDLPNRGQALYPLRHGNSWRQGHEEQVQWIDRSPGVWEFMGSILVGD